MSAFEKAKLAQMTAATEIDWAVAYEELLPIGIWAGTGLSFFTADLNERRRET